MFKFSSLLVASLFLFACMPRSEVAVRSAGGRKEAKSNETIINSILQLPQILRYQSPDLECKVYQVLN